MIRFILKWLAYTFIAFSAFQVVFELFSYSQTHQALQQDALKLFTGRLNDMGVCLAKVAFGSAMVGIYEILINVEMQNVMKMKAKKDLGNWPPSLQVLVL